MAAISALIRSKLSRRAAMAADAHSTREIDLTRWGVEMARKRRHAEGARPELPAHG